MIGETHGVGWVHDWRDPWGRLGSWLARPMGQVGFMIGENHGVGWIHDWRDSWSRLGSWLARPRDSLGSWLAKPMVGWVHDSWDIWWVWSMISEIRICWVLSMIIEKYVGLSLWLGCLCVLLTSPLPFCFFLRLTTYLPTFTICLSLTLLCSYNLPFDCQLVSQTVYASFYLSICLSLVSQAAFYDHLPFPLPFCLSLRLPVYLSTLPFPCLPFLRLSAVHGIYPSMFVCFLYREKA